KSSNGYIYAYSSTNYFLRTQNNFTSIDEDVPEIANRVILHPNYPNPFNPATVISFELPESAQTTLEVYDIQGRLVESLISNRLMQQGTHQIEWNSGNRASGLYVYRLASGNEILSGKMTLVK
ncbi:MAG: T9SS type A sorting domain-containing protein, partial [Balneolales bacterium]|nr:T9SS type A sorting domain-containing protein [Balneolales bacterium]